MKEGTGAVAAQSNCLSMTRTGEADEKYEEFNLQQCPYWDGADDCVYYKKEYSPSFYRWEVARRQSCVNYDAVSEQYCEGTQESTLEVPCSEFFLLGCSGEVV